MLLPEDGGERNCLGLGVRRGGPCEHESLEGRYVKLACSLEMVVRFLDILGRGGRAHPSNFLYVFLLHDFSILVDVNSLEGACHYVLPPLGSSLDSLSNESLLHTLQPLFFVDSSISVGIELPDQVLN